VVGSPLPQGVRRIFVRLDRASQDMMRLSEVSFVNDRGRLALLSAGHWHGPADLLVDGDLLFLDGEGPSRFWFDGPGFISDPLTRPPVRLVRYVPAPPATQPVPPAAP
jgi:hypothetical protein